ncbi:MAG: porin family protein [Muribaculaceae bacterium]
MKEFKRLMIVACLAIMAVLPATAQFSFGPKVGIAVNDLKFNQEIINKDNRAGFTGGLTAELMIPVLNLGFDISAMYVHRSATISIKDFGDKSVANRDYIELPINLKWKIGLPLIGKIITPYIFTGPSFSFLVSKKSMNEFFENKSCDIAWNFGAGIQLFKKVQIGASYGLGMTNTLKFIGKDDHGYKIEGKNSYWTITTAYLF